MLRINLHRANVRLQCIHGLVLMLVQNSEILIGLRRSIKKFDRVNNNITLHM